MPSFVVTEPDGTKHRVTVPEGVGPDEVGRVLKQNLPAAMKVPEHGLAEEAAHGFMKPFEGAREMWSYGGTP